MITEMFDSLGFSEEVALRLSKGQKTNFFLTTEVYTALMKDGKFGRMDFPGGVYFFLEKEDQYELFYFLEKTAEPVALPDFDRPLVLEEVMLETKERSPSQQAWIHSGLMPYLQRKRLYFLAKNAPMEERRVTFATKNMGQEIFDLMESVFEPLTSMLPTFSQLEEDIMAERVLVRRDGEKLLGFLRFGQTKQGEMLWQIAVTPSARGRKTGESLVQDWIFLEKNNTKKFTLWVREDNLPALKLYENLGFVPDARIASVMIKTEKRG